MKRQKRKTIVGKVVTTILAVLFIPAIVMAFGPGNGMGKGMGRGMGDCAGMEKCMGMGMGKGMGYQRGGACGIWRNPEMVKELGLTDAQVKDLKEADFAAREKRLAEQHKLDELRLEMDKAFNSETVDDKAVLKVAEKIAEVQGRLYVQRMESRLTALKILNKDQIEKLKALGKDRGPRGKMGRHHRGRGPFAGENNPSNPSVDE